MPVITPLGDSPARQIHPLLRWTVFALSLAVVAFILFESIPAFTSPTGHWSDRLVLLGFLVALSWPFLLMARLCYREEYLRVWKIISFFAAVITALFLMSAIQRLEIEKYIYQAWSGHRWFVLVGLPANLLLLFGPLWAGIWLYARSVQAGRRYLMVVEGIAMGERAVEDPI